MTFLPDLDLQAGRVLYALRRTGGLRESEIHLYALGVEAGHKVRDLLEHLEQRGQARREGNVWSAIG